MNTMWNYPEEFDLIVIGAGHAGAEAAAAAAGMGARTLLLTMNVDTIGKMSCNPAIGGTAKGIIVREIDALGGWMGKWADATGIQCRMLNASKGPAVWAPRAQTDKFAYQNLVKHTLEKLDNLSIKQGTVEKLIVENGAICGVETMEGIGYRCKTLIISSGTFMQGLLHIGNTQFAGGRAGDKPSVGLSLSLKELGFKLGRLKTGTPPRINRRSIDFSQLEEQKGDEEMFFSFDAPIAPRMPQTSCYITYTSAKTKEIIQKNLHRSALYGGRISGVGPRYCPSIEDKVVRFADKERHQVFLEPEGLNTEEIYVNGLSSSLPFDVQHEYIQSIPGLEKADIMRPAYAIEYDYALCGQVGPTLETHAISGLYFAGQINGTTGYEEAAAQGFIAGVNAALKVQKKAPFILKRTEAYMGVLIDDLITKDLTEPYRMFTSRAESRLHLRQDNADLRLRQYGYQLGLISEVAHNKVELKRQIIESETVRLSKIFKQKDAHGYSLTQILARPESDYASMLLAYPDEMVDHGVETNFQIALKVKYQGYLTRQDAEIARLETLEVIAIPANLDCKEIIGLSNEAREKLGKIKPHTLGQASRIAGISPSELGILMIAIRKHNSCCTCS